MFFLVFPFFSQIFRIFTMLNVVYDPLLTRKTTISENNSFMTPLFYSACTFARIRQHYFSKYWGDGCMGRPPTSNVGRSVFPVPPRSPPLPGKVVLAHELFTDANNFTLIKDC